MKVFQKRLTSVPYDIKWYVTHDTGEVFVLLASGSGNVKAGLANGIFICRELDKGGFDIVDVLQTDHSGTDNRPICNCLGFGMITDYNILCCGLGSNVRIYTINSNTSSSSKSPLAFDEIIEFQADFYEDKRDSSVKCIHVLLDGRIITAGEDGVCRLWELLKTEDDKYNINLLMEYTGHKAPIMDISVHIEQELLCTASNDGFCTIWAVNTGQVVCTINHRIGSNTKAQCLGCSFSSDSEYLVTMQSSGGNGVVLIKWGFHNKNQDEIDNIEATAVMTKVVGKKPARRFVINDHGSYIAVGDSEGYVHILRASDFKVLSVTRCHDFAITGLTFAPSILSLNPEMNTLLCSCSMDSTLSSFIVTNELSTIAIIIYVILAIVMLLMLVYMSYSLISRGKI
jgi:WD40 repeat protein